MPQPTTLTKAELLARLKRLIDEEKIWIAHDGAMYAIVDAHLESTPGEDDLELQLDTGARRY